MSLTTQDLTAITKIVNSEATKIVQSETKKIILEESRKIINGQSSLKSELLGEIGKLRNEMSKGFEEQKQKTDQLDKKLTKRINTIGLQIANLEDDTPTRDEYDKLEKRVENLEKPSASA